MKKNLPLLTILALPVALTICFIYQARAEDKPLPALLLNATSNGGTITACPPETEAEARMRKQIHMPEALSPEINQRLSHDFPPGSNEDKLKETLNKQGFGDTMACKKDDSIRSKSFYQKTRSMFSSEINATVYWKVNKSMNIVWTKGYIFYTGL